MSHRNTLLIGLISLVAVTPLNLLAARLQLTKNGKATATIVLAEKPRAAAQLAAFELQHYIEKISAAKIPIVREPTRVSGTRILIGESRSTKALGLDNSRFKKQQYLIKTLPQTLILIGRDHDGYSQVDYSSYTSIYHALPNDIGTCYAAHAFLENQLGVRWYYPNESIGEVVPKRPTLVIGDLNIRRKPDAPIRMLYPLFSNTEKLYFIDYDQPSKLQASWVDARQSLLYWIRLRYWGGMRYNANHSFHGFDKAFGKSHPEWFSTKSYARMKQLPFQSAVQPCLTANGFLNQVVAIAREHFDGKRMTHPGTNHATAGNFFPIVPNDNTNMCRCPTCTAQYRSGFGPQGVASHYVWKFVNDVAREVRKTHPQAMVSGLAYFNYTTPPKDLVFEPNVAVTFCKFYQKYHDQSYQQRDYQRIAQYVHRNKARFFTTYEYPVHPFMDAMPFPCLVPRVQAEDVRQLRKLKCFQGGTMDRTSGATYQGNRPSGLAWSSPVMDFMNVYWRVKLYDDFDFNVEKGLAEYYQQFFGPGATGMRRFYTAIENRWMKLKGAEGSHGWWNKLGTRAFLKELNGYLNLARQATQKGTLYRRRVDLIDAGIMQYLLKARAKYERSSESERSPIATAAVAHTTPKGGNWGDDSTWTNSLPNEMERDGTDKPVPRKTQFQLAHDGKRLYLLVRCLEPRTAQLRAKTRDKDIGGFKDDSIEVFIDPNGRGKKFYHLCINSIGTIYDAAVDPTAIGAKANTNWDSKVQVRTAVRQNYWEVRAALPFSELGRTVVVGSTLRFNISRNQFAEPRQPSYSTWSAASGKADPRKFGVVTFNGAQDQGRLIWNCDFETSSFASKTNVSPLIGIDGWYENTNYANRGWDKTWQVVGQVGHRVATSDLNRTNHSDLVPFHAVEIRPGLFSIEAQFKRSSLIGSMPTLRVADRSGKAFGIIYAWPGRGDLIAIEQTAKNKGRQNFGDKAHRLGKVSAAGKWFGLKLVINTIEKNVTGYVRSANGKWARLNKTPLRYYDEDAKGTQLFLGLGSRQIKATPENRIEMDNVRVVQLR